MALCTGNVARSAMLGYMLQTLSDAAGYDWRVRTAGTHAIEGLAMSARTKAALLSLELGEHRYNAHRSRQLRSSDVEWADVIFASEADHVAYVRSRHPEGAARTVTLGQFVREAPLEAPFLEQVAIVAAREPSAAFDVADPAGGEEADYVACARELWSLVEALAVLVDDEQNS